MSALPRRARRATASIAYPLVVLLAVAVAWSLLRVGVAPGASSTLAYVFVLVAVALLERIMPYRAGWAPRSFAEARQDLGYIGIAALVKPIAAVVGRGLVVGVVAGLAPLVSHGGGFSLLVLPTWARAVLALAATDLAKYAIHRASHEHALLFRFHEEHHAPEAVHVLNGVRLHPINTLWNLVPDVAFPLAFGVDAHTLVLVAAFQGAVSVLQHANVAFATGPLDALLSTPNVHRLHHARDPELGHGNYGSTFLVWDALFGTRRVPTEVGAALDVGLEPRPDRPTRPRRLLEQLVWPFCASQARCRFVTTPPRAR